MNIFDLILLQINAHLIADYTCQTDNWIEDKKKGFKSHFLYWHTLIIFLLSFTLSFQLNFVFASVLIASSHLIIDGFKLKFEKWMWGEFGYFFDQIWHIVIMIGIVILHTKIMGIEPYFNYNLPTYYLLILTGFIICTKPSNIFIKASLELYGIKSNFNVLKTGRIIGITERSLTYILLFYSQFEAIGFLIAAKSILRYEKEPSERTEYVLIGTMLSFGIAIVIYFIIKEIKPFIV